VYGDAIYCDAAGTGIGDYRTAEFDLDRLASATIICQPAAFFRRTAFDAVGGLNETLAFAMDYDLWIRIGRRFQCSHIPEVIATYRLHEASKTISSESLVKNSEEILSITIRHFGWAPLTRIYTACSIGCTLMLPGLLAKYRFPVVATAAFCTVLRSLWLNRGLNRNDLRLLTRDNCRKLFRSRLELMTGRRS